MAVVLKIALDGTIHRLSLGQNPNYAAVNAAIQKIYCGACRVKYLDEEDEYCTLTEGTFTDFQTTGKEDVNGNLVWKLTVLPTTPNGGRVLAVPPVCGPKVASKRRRSARQDQVPQSTWQEDPRDLAELARQFDDFPKTVQKKASKKKENKTRTERKHQKTGNAYKQIDDAGAVATISTWKHAKAEVSEKLMAETETQSKITVATKGVKAAEHEQYEDLEGECGVGDKDGREELDAGWEGYEEDADGNERHFDAEQMKVMAKEEEAKDREHKVQQEAPREENQQQQQEEEEGKEDEKEEEIEIEGEAAVKREPAAEEEAGWLGHPLLQAWPAADSNGRAVLPPLVCSTLDDDGTNAGEVDEQLWLGEGADTSPTDPMPHLWPNTPECTPPPSPRGQYSYGHQQVVWVPVPVWVPVLPLVS